MMRFKNMLFVANIDDADLSALERVVSLAENHQASLVVASVMENGTRHGNVLVKDLWSQMKSVHEQKLVEMTQPFRDRVHTRTKVLQGKAFLEIIREVLRNDHDLVITVAESHSWLVEHVFGSQEMHLLRKCPCPVWLFKGQNSKNYRCILAAVDVDDEYSESELETRAALNRNILELASSIALATLGELHVVHTWTAFGEGAMRGPLIGVSEEKVEAYVEKARHRHSANLDALIKEIGGALGQDTMDYLKPQIHLEKGLPSDQIPPLQEKLRADLLVMGTVARVGVPGFLIGNTAESILNQIKCDVLAVKPPGFVTPVTLTD